MLRIYIFVIAVGLVSQAKSQGLDQLLKKVAGKDSSTAAKVEGIFKNISTVKKDSLTNTDIVSGLKEALSVGTQRSVQQLSALDGFFKNAAIKILMPPEAQKVEQTLRRIGLNKEVDDAILSMNRAAEDAAKSAAPIFINAIKGMSIKDAVGILKGGDSAATKYLRSKTSTSLNQAFQPIVKESLGKVDATKYWNTVTTAYNKIPFVKRVNTDLTGYVTDKALSGIFYQVALEEQKIRKDPVARTTDILKKVFGK
ncbi:MAG: DUF4197 domain-containing protein [Bacteroidota bacterium]|nr:DUF4197 domain-containing protein [Bacteroidota bacterium]